MNAEESRSLSARQTIAPKKIYEKQGWFSVIVDDEAFFC
jgi:hypothetical protein